ncbi:oligopeptide transport system permease protein [Planifilum fimeticola]|uniref:Oligopeptide transport system permease protein n=1 Tax=Planifilum fimeticola TaxID=201975 RepID=A0A2T0LDU7_9BACL|nr:ABC transporter permease [Planifilum fimeticola]PRX40241.1 oligopeptide transport system permease protein [Planifilum fimeticola]
MGSYVARRLIYLLLTLWLVITCTFFLMHFLPGSPLSNEEKLPPNLKGRILEEYGLDKPVPVQYALYLGNLLQGDLGLSFSYDGRSVSGLIAQGFPASLQIGLQGLLFGGLIGILLGTVAALKRGTWVDNTATILAVIGVSVPSFVLAAVFSYYIGVQMGILPPGGWESFAHTILPSLALSFLVIAQVTRYIRSELLDVFSQDYMKTAKAKGMGRRVIVFRHALRNALIPTVTVLGPLTVNLITGSLVVEQIFGVPGLSTLFVNSIMTNDYTLIMGTTIFYAFLFMVSVFIVDILYGVIDPRIRVAGMKE